MLGGKFDVVAMTHRLRYAGRPSLLCREGENLFVFLIYA
jgi:hypothetical protein